MAFTLFDNRLLTRIVGDNILLKPKDETKAPVFIHRLRPGKKKTSRWGDINHDAIIGKRARDVILTSKGIDLRAVVPTLEDYVINTPRLVTPVRK